MSEMKNVYTHFRPTTPSRTQRREQVVVEHLNLNLIIYNKKHYLAEFKNIYLYGI